MNTHTHTVSILSLGCPKNLVDSEILLGYLQAANFRVSYDISRCDIALINTCAFVEEARQETLDMIDELAEMKKAGYIKKIIVCGCFPKLFPDGCDGYRDSIDAYVGTAEIPQIATIVKAVLAGEKPMEVSKDSFLYSHTSPRFFLTPPFVKYIKIAEGCNHRCSFCTIPAIRGGYQSRPMESIIEEVESLAKKGLKEAILISQDSSYYGVDLYKKKMLASLLERLSHIKELAWIRVMYVHPANVTDELLEVISRSPKVCKYIDMPLQHINDRILKSMGRNFTKEETYTLVKKIRERVPGVSLRTTFIVGYPGETYEEYNELLDFVSDVAFDKMGVFMYSPEHDTRASELKDTVTEEVKKSRFQDLMLMQQKISRKKMQKLRGKQFDVLVEGENPDRPEYVIGRTYMDAPEIDGVVYIKKKKGITVGNMYTIKIVDSFEYDVLGEVCGL